MSKEIKCFLSLLNSVFQVGLLNPNIIYETDYNLSTYNITIQNVFYFFCHNYTFWTISVMGASVQKLHTRVISNPALINLHQDWDILQQNIEPVPSQFSSEQKVLSW